MVFYTDANGLIRMNGNILPQRAFVINTFANETVISLETYEAKWSNTIKDYTQAGYSVFSPIQITEIEKKDGSTYTDLQEFLTLNPTLLK